MKSCVSYPNQPQNDFYFETETPHEEYPVIKKINTLLEEDERKYLIDKSYEIGLQRSTVIGKDGINRTDPNRTSSTAFIDKSMDDIITCIEKKISSASGKPHDHLEPLQITHYGKDQKYNPHYDWLKNNSNQRTTTVFTYIKGFENEMDTCGGATVFPKLKNENNNKLRFYPVSGTSIMWENVKENGEGEELTLHGGEPVTCNSTKIGLNAWFREKPIEY
tara:strand:+ start:481 stop:1140 length:660 start_codon:yes stop_codon:yes gene_type:complete